MDLEEEKIRFFKREMENHRIHVIQNMKKISHPSIVESFAKILMYSWQEDLSEAHSIVNILELNKMDISSLQYDLETFMEEYGRYFEAQGF